MDEQALQRISDINGYLTVIGILMEKYWSDQDTPLSIIDCNINAMGKLIKKLSLEISAEF